MQSEKIFQERIKQLRTKYNLTQKQVADNIGITTTGYQNYEVGRRKPTFDIVPALADFFDVSTDYLFGRTDNPLVLRN